MHVVSSSSSGNNPGSLFLIGFKCMDGFGMEVAWRVGVQVGVDVQATKAGSRVWGLAVQ